MTSVQQKQANQNLEPVNKENPLFNIIFNIFLPVLILNRLAPKLGENGPVIGLILALLFPLAYGAYEYYRTRTHNLISILGFINVLFTGGFALVELEGRWFAFKEAFFPLLIGIGVLISIFIKRPFMKKLFWNSSIFNVEKIESQLSAENKVPLLDRLFTVATGLFALSFLISSALNYWLAIKIFIPIDSSLSASDRSQILNEQIAQMTWKGYVVIALPMMGFMFGVLFYILYNLKKITGSDINALLKIEAKS